MTNPIVIDLSHWNDTPDWAVLKSNGTVGVIHKATEGIGYIDDTLFRRAGPAMAAGLCWSTYHFLTGGEPEDQMAFYLNTINPRQGERVCIDHEADATLDELKRAVGYIRQVRPDLQITIYSGHTIKEQLGDDYDPYLAVNTSLWIAHYSSTPSWPSNTWLSWSLHQYTDQATAIGASGAIDGNKWNGDPEDLPKWFGPDDAVPVPEPTPEPAPRVSITIVTTAEVEITVNGEKWS